MCVTSGGLTKKQNSHLSTWEANCCQWSHERIELRNLKERKRTKEKEKSEKEKESSGEKRKREKKRKKKKIAPISIEVKSKFFLLHLIISSILSLMI